MEETTMSKIQNWLSNNPFVAFVLILGTLFVVGKKFAGGKSRSRKLRALAKARAAKKRKARRR